MGSRRGVDGPFAPRDPNIVTARFGRAKPLEEQRMVSRERLVQGNGVNMARSQSPAQLELDEDDTQDSFMKRIIREDNRGHGRAQSEQVAPAQAFRKARTRPRTGLTIENLARHTHVASPAPPEVRSKSSLGSVSSNRTDPPLNIPHEWGRKAKRNPQWIRRIHTDNPALYMENGEVNGNVDWQEAAANTPLPSVEVDDSPLSRASSRHGKPKRPVSPSPGNDEGLSSDDFNESDILSSTPAPRKGMKLDEIRRLELDAGLEDSTMYPTPPREKSRSRSRPRTLPAAKRDARSRTKSEDHHAERNSQHAQTEGAVPSKSDDQLTSANRSKADKYAPPSPINVTHKSSHTVGDVDRKIVPNIAGTPRPQHRREDSRDILRKLSRTPSATPSPSIAKSLKPSSIPAPIISNQNGLDKPTTSRSHSHRMQEPFSRRLDKTAFMRHNEPEKVVTASCKDAKSLPAATRITNAQQNASQSPPVEGKSELAPSNGNPPKTPVVTGAWVDTMIGPDTTPKRSDDSVNPPNSSPHLSQNREQETTATAKSASAIEKTAATTRPVPLPSSALEAVLAEARQIGEDMLGEATINSLQDLVIDQPLPTPAADDFEDDTIENLKVPSTKPRTAAEKQRLDELVRIKKMNQRINKLQGDMHSMHRGVNNIEKMAQPPVDNAPVSSVQDPQDARKLNGGSVIVTDCKTCEAPAKMLVSGLRQILWVYQNDTTSFKGFRLGPGFWVLLLLSIVPYVFMELIACMIFCRPVFADSMEGFGLYPDAPELPFVIPTMLLRPFRPIWRPVLENLGPLCVWLFNFVVYCFQNGVVGSATTASASATTSSASLRPTAFADFGLGQDVYV